MSSQQPTSDPGSLQMPETAVSLTWHWGNCPVLCYHGGLNKSVVHFHATCLVTKSFGFLVSVFHTNTQYEKWPDQIILDQI